MGQLASSIADYRVRVQALLELKLAVWDVLANCERPGSLDSSIVRGSETYNPLPELVGRLPDLRAILFNGQKAHTLFERNFRAYREQSSLDFKTMPSTSPAYAAMPKTEKIDYWNAVLDLYLHSHN